MLHVFALWRMGVDRVSLSHRLALTLRSMTLNFDLPVPTSQMLGLQVCSTITEMYGVGTQRQGFCVFFLPLLREWLGVPETLLIFDCDPLFEFTSSEPRELWVSLPRYDLQC